jgi:DNA-binding XRE family transcriptional regulator
VYKVGETTSGNILVEMTPREWEAVIVFFRTSDVHMAHLGEELARYRRQNELSQSEVARQLDVSRTYVSFIERGLAENVSVKVRQRIAELVRNG